MVTALLLAPLALCPGQPREAEGVFRLVPLVRSDAGAEEAPPEEARDSDPVLAWNEIALGAIRADRTPPPAAARNLAMVHAAVYDAVNAVCPTHQPFLVDVEPPPCTSPEAAAAAAAHRVLLDLHPAQRESFDAALRRSLGEVPDGPGKDEGVILGRFVAGKVLAWREDDGSRRRADYSPAPGPGVWRPAPPRYPPPLLPQWSGVTPFVLPSVRPFRPPAPPPLSGAAYAKDFREVKELGGVDSPARTPEQTEIARFWADDVGTVTPPGHWNRIAQTVARARGNGLADNARLFALLNLSLADAAVVCWDAKYHYGFWRPVYGIREADTDDNPETEPDRDWTPLLETPPFPSYTSGHSTFSGAAAAVLAIFFGTDAIPFSDTSDGLPGVRRSYPGFRAAAAEAGKSRIYGGIHWEFDNARGLATGRAVARYVTRHALLPRCGCALTSSR